MTTVMLLVTNEIELSVLETVALIFSCVLMTACEFGLNTSPFGMKDVSTILFEYALIRYVPSEVFTSNRLFFQVWER